MLTYDISDDDLPHDVISGLEKKGWKFDQGEQEWRQHNDAGPFSPHRADHVRQWEADVNAVIADLETVENLTQDGADNLSSQQVQNNDTHIAGHGVHVGGGASVTGSVDGVGAGGTGSVTVENKIEGVRKSHQFEADAATKGFIDANPNATPEEIEEVRKSHQFEADAATKGFIDGIANQQQQ